MRRTIDPDALPLCEDCLSRHLGPPCGMDQLSRWKTVRTDSSVTPTASKRNYYDADALEDMLIPRDAEEQMMEETKGAGAATQEEIKQAEQQGLGELVAYHYGADDAPVVAGG